MYQAHLHRPHHRHSRGWGRWCIRGGMNALDAIYRGLTEELTELGLDVGHRAASPRTLDVIVADPAGLTKRPVALLRVVPTGIEISARPVQPPDPGQTPSGVWTWWHLSNKRLQGWDGGHWLVRLDIPFEQPDAVELVVATILEAVRDYGGADSGAGGPDQGPARDGGPQLSGGGDPPADRAARGGSQGGSRWIN